MANGAKVAHAASPEDALAQDADDFVMARAFEILREWINDPEITEALPADELRDQAERIKASDVALKTPR